jgi:Family of unknown function (DUF6159)
MAAPHSSRGVLDSGHHFGNTHAVERIRNGWRLAKASWAVLSQDRELVAIPIIAGIISLVVFAVVAVPGVALLGGGDDDAVGWAVWLVLAIAGLLATWVSVIGQAAVVSGAGQRMDGTDPSLGTAFAGARTRTGRLLEWAVLATVVAVVLDALRDRLGIFGSILASLGNMAFNVLSFLALPVIVFENLGAIDGFKRSAQLLRGTWGEQLTFTFGIGVIGFLVSLPGIGILVGAVATGIAAVQVIGVALGIVWVVAVLAVTSALSAVFKTALYRYAVQAPVDDAFDTADLSGAFRRRNAR